MKILVTGATGFIGRAFIPVALSRGWQVRAALRRNAELPPSCEGIVVGDIDGATNWNGAFEGCDAVVHLAARVHVMKETEGNPEAAFRRVNTDGMLHLASEAAAAGVSRFLNLSTIKVNGEGKTEPYTESDLPVPEDPYALSKWEGEKGLEAICSKTGMVYTVLRPPLVYGPGVTANFLKLIEAVEKGFPFPLACVHNKRSLLYVGNLVEAMAAALEAPDVVGKTFLLSDGAPVSTPNLIRAIAKSLEKQPRLLPVPAFALKSAGLILGKKKQIDRLLGSLFVDSSAFEKAAQWKPPYSLEEGLAQTAVWFRRRQAQNPKACKHCRLI